MNPSKYSSPTPFGQQNLLSRTSTKRPQQTIPRGGATQLCTQTHTNKPTHSQTNTPTSPRHPIGSPQPAKSALKTWESLTKPASWEKNKLKRKTLPKRAPHQEKLETALPGGKPRPAEGNVKYPTPNLGGSLKKYGSMYVTQYDNGLSMCTAFYSAWGTRLQYKHYYSV